MQLTARRHLQLIVSPSTLGTVGSFDIKRIAPESVSGASRNVLAGGLVWLHRGHLRESDGGMHHQMEGGGKIKHWAALACIAILATELLVYAFTT